MNSLNQAREIWQSCSNWVVLTGAGVSTASGIGDYRDDEGEWKRNAPIMHQDFVADVSARQRYWARSQKGFPQFLAAKPNDSHRLLADLEAAGQVSAVITQNVDGLHQQAGQRCVVDLHGRLDEVVCLQCGAIQLRADLQYWLDEHNPDVEDDFYTPAPDGDADTGRTDFTQIRVPGCDCGGVLKPNVVFYGDNVPRAVVDECYGLIDGADGLLVMGTSLMVFSSFRFVRYAHQKNIPILAINRGKTRGEALFSARLSGECASELLALSR